MEGKTETQKDYFERINKILVYINDNLNEDFDIESLAKISNFSAFHFHRIMKAYLNEPLWAYIKRIRLDMAARMLNNSIKPINEIAYEVGYDTPSSFIKAFKRRFELSPGEFRKQKALAPHAYNPRKSDVKNVIKVKPKIRTIKDKKAIYIQTLGYHDSSISPIWGKLVEFIKKNRLFGFVTEFIGISYDDPKITETDKCRYEACVTVRKEIKPEGEIGFKTIPGGKFAIFKYKGSYENLDIVYTEIFDNWLAKSRYTLRNTPSFEHYLTDPNRTKPEKNVTEIYVPVE